jgi:hypothetical protein
MEGIYIKTERTERAYPLLLLRLDSGRSQAQYASLFCPPIGKRTENKGAVPTAGSLTIHEKQLRRNHINLKIQTNV